MAADRSIDREGRAAQAAYGPLVPDSPTHSLFSLPSAVLGNSVWRSHCWEATSWIGPQVGWESTSASAAHKTEAVHKGIKCNACDMDPIRGE